MLQLLIVFSCLAAALSHELLLDTTKLNELIRSSDASWVAAVPNEAIGSNFWQRSQCEYFYKPGYCNMRNFALGCHNYCVYKGDTITLRCANAFGEKFCRDGHLTLQQSVRQLRGKPDAFKQRVYHLLYACYLDAACNTQASILDTFRHSPTTTTTTSTAAPSGGGVEPPPSAGGGDGGDGAAPDTGTGGGSSGVAGATNATGGFQPGRWFKHITEWIVTTG